MKHPVSHETPDGSYHVAIGTRALCIYTMVNFSPMSPKLLPTCPHRVENHRITKVFFEIDIVKQSIKIIVKLDFFTNISAV